MADRRWCNVAQDPLHGGPAREQEPGHWYRRDDCRRQETARRSNGDGSADGSEQKTQSHCRRTVHSGARQTVAVGGEARGTEFARGAPALLTCDLERLSRGCLKQESRRSSWTGSRKKHDSCSTPGLGASGSFGTLVWGTPARKRWSIHNVPRPVRNRIGSLSDGCMKGKQTVTAFLSRSMTKTTRVFKRLHTDAMGSMRTRWKDGAKYVPMSLDDYSRYVVVYCMKNKSKIVTKLKAFTTLHKIQWGGRLKCLRSDNAAEFVNKTVADICQRNGIVHQRTVTYSIQQNGAAERMNRLIMEKARSMLHYKYISTEKWSEAMSTAVYLVNRPTNTASSDVTPYEVTLQGKPRMEHLRVFGSQGYARVDDMKRTKIKTKRFRCTFLG
uniref:Putative polyprotein n=1 Tax=Phytophthora infestans TaxID=4787 RepID=Q572K5_PHYIN|nr:putative polyprotein [Phytophthora infestans]